MPLNYGIEPALLLVGPELLQPGPGQDQARRPQGRHQRHRSGLEEVRTGIPLRIPFSRRALRSLLQCRNPGRKIFRYFVLIAVFISCLGLLGLSAFVAEQKTKEIGIRKALGASVPRVVLLLTKQFLLWVLLANIIAWPVAYVAMRSWLDNYPFRTSLGLPLFLLSAAAALVIAMLTVSFQAVRAARVNPVDSLRYE